MDADEKQKIKEELYSLYKTLLKNNNNNNNDNLNNITKIKDISSFNNLSLINDIKKYFMEILSFNEKCKANLLQLENIIKKLEFDIKYYLKRLLYYKIQNNSLEIKLNVFASMEEDYEGLKEKLKYEGGKFLENDRKNNEIMILRNENSKIKKEIKKLESQKVIMESEYKNKIKILEKDKKELNKKIEEMEKNNKKNNFSPNINLKLNKNNKENTINKKIKRNNFNLSNIYNLINYSNNNNINNYIKNNRQLINFHSPKNDLLYLDRSRNQNYYNNKTSINTNLYTETYHKMTNGLNANKILFPFNSKYTRNKSLSVMKTRDFNFSESKTMSFNNNNFNKSENKQKSFNKIMNTKKQNTFSLNEKDLKNKAQFEKKYLNRNFNRIISAKNIKNNKI